jgi:hypothetical protein
MLRSRVLDVLLHNVRDPEALVALAAVDDRGAWAAVLRLGHETEAAVTLARDRPHRVTALRERGWIACALLATDDYEQLVPSISLLPHIDFDRMDTPTLTWWVIRLANFTACMSWVPLAEELLRREGELPVTIPALLYPNMSDDLHHYIIDSNNDGIVLGIEHVRDTNIVRALFKRYVNKSRRPFVVWERLLIIIRRLDPNHEADRDLVASVVERWWFDEYSRGASRDEARAILSPFLLEKRPAAIHILAGMPHPPPAILPDDAVYEVVQVANPFLPLHVRLYNLERHIHRPDVLHDVLHNLACRPLVADALRLMPRDVGMEAIVVDALHTNFEEWLLEAVLDNVKPDRLPLDDMRHRLDTMEPGWGWVANFVAPAAVSDAMLAYMTVYRTSTADRLAPMFRDARDVWGMGFHIARAFSEDGWRALPFDFDPLDHPITAPWWDMVLHMPAAMVEKLLDTICSEGTLCARTISIVIAKGLATHPRVIRMVRESSLRRFMMLNMERLGVHDRLRAINAALLKI